MICNVRFDSSATFAQVKLFNMMLKPVQPMIVCVYIYIYIYIYTVFHLFHGLSEYWILIGWQVLIKLV